MIYQPKLLDFELFSEDFMVEFQQLLVEELQRRRIPYEEIELDDIGGVNLDIYIVYSKERVASFFQYLSWSHLRRRTLRSQSLEDYTRKYAENYFRYLTENIDYDLRSSERDMDNDLLWNHLRVTARKTHTWALEMRRKLDQVVV